MFFYKNLILKIVFIVNLNLINYTINELKEPKGRGNNLVIDWLKINIRTIKLGLYNYQNP